MDLKPTGQSHLKFGKIRDANCLKVTPTFSMALDLML